MLFRESLAINRFFFGFALFQEILCKTSIVILEYTKTTMFMWIFIEGLYLHNVIAVAVFNDSFLKFYSAVAWGFPLLLTPIWIVTMVLSTENSEKYKEMIYFKSQHKKDIIRYFFPFSDAGICTICYRIIGY